MGCSQKNDIHYFKNKEKRYSSATMRPYVIYGIKYYPKKTYIGETFRGVASWYGPNFNGKKHHLVKSIICMVTQRHIKHYLCTLL